MKKHKKGLLLLILVVLVAIISLLTKSVLVKKPKLDTYLALGDGLSLGVSSQGTIGRSFTDIYADQLAQDKKISKFYKEFARHNMKSSELLKIIERDAIGIINSNSIKISSLIKRASTITISVGINDILTQFNYSSSTRTLTYNASNIYSSLELVQLNLYHIIEQIKVINEVADIYLLGSYFLYPWINQNKSESIDFFTSINSYFQEVAADAEVKFVDISFIGDQEYLSNLNSFYPNDDGYQLIADKLSKI